MDTERPATAPPVADGTVFDGAGLVARIRQWGRELGFDAVGVGGIDLSAAEPGLAAWLEAGFHGEMDYMARHGMKRARAAELVPGALRVISVRMAVLSSTTTRTTPGRFWPARIRRM